MHGQSASAIERLLGNVEDYNVSTAQLLVSAKILATSLDRDDVLAWINRELNGYGRVELDEIPEYRRLRGKWLVLNPHRGWEQVRYESTKSELLLCTAPMRESVPRLEKSLADGGTSFSMQSPEHSRMMREMLKTDWQVQFDIDAGQIHNIIANVRSRVLDWALELRTVGVSGNEANTAAEEIKDADAMQTIKLERAEWAFDEKARLGPAGGFGEVFKGKGEDGEVAVKRLLLTADNAAHRELRIGASLRGRSLKHVVPILDCGQDALSDRYFLVMPICQKSLADDLRTSGAKPLPEARKIMLAIMAGLNEVIDLVHRDLKPGNVLYGEGRWQVADFGIAKFVEDSTSLNTLRESLTPGYGAPEQWRGEGPTAATDIYALGCIMHALLTGAPPFVGSQYEVREAHLHQSAPTLDMAGPRLSALVSQMLRKSPDARPTLQRCIDTFTKDVAPPQGVAVRHAGLANVAKSIASEQSVADAKAQAEKALSARRAQLTKEAQDEFSQLRKRLFESIKDEAAAAGIQNDKLTLGQGTLTFIGAQALPRAEGGTSNLQACSWDVAAYGLISVSRPHIDNSARVQEHNGYTWSASLVFAKTPDDPSYRWRELAFFRIFSRSGSNPNEPEGVAPTDREFAIALSNTMGGFNLAYGPLPIDGEDEEAFQHRWISLLSKAAEGKLTRPNYMPIPKNYFDAL